MKKKTLEEVAERLQKDKYGIFISKDADVKGQFVIDTAKAAFSSGMKEGAKWQQEQDNKYNEEDIRIMLRELSSDLYEIDPLHSLEEWFEQYKKGGNNE
jgi:hypothetical protein